MWALLASPAAHKYSTRGCRSRSKQRYTRPHASTLHVGDPVRMIHHLGLGVWAFLASPAAGLVASARGRGPLRLAMGLVDGFRGLLAHVVFAISNAAAKWSGAARKAWPQKTPLGDARRAPGACGVCHQKRRCQWSGAAHKARLQMTRLGMPA